MPHTIKTRAYKLSELRTREARDNPAYGLAILRDLETFGPETTTGDGTYIERAIAVYDEARRGAR